MVDSIDAACLGEACGARPADPALAPGDRRACRPALLPARRGQHAVGDPPKARDRLGSTADPPARRVGRRDGGRRPRPRAPRRLLAAEGFAVQSHRSRAVGEPTIGLPLAATRARHTLRSRVHGRSLMVMDSRQRGQRLRQLAAPAASHAHDAELRTHDEHLRAPSPACGSRGPPAAGLRATRALRSRSRRATSALRPAAWLGSIGLSSATHHREVPCAPVSCCCPPSKKTRPARRPSATS